MSPRNLPLSGNGVKDLEHRIVRPDGTVRWLWAIGRTFFEGQGEARRPVRASGIAIDVTERKRLEREILEVSGREQRRIGHDLHDDLCQKLGAIQLLSGVLARDLAADAHPRALQAERISAQAREATECARLLAHGLSPVALDSDGLGAALQELAEGSAQRFHLRCEFCGQAPVVPLEPGAATHLYRIAQEAISNAVWHGRAHRVTISLMEVGNRFELKITDDGRGFDPTAPTAGMGLRIMKYRAATIGASLEVHSAPAAGTTVTCAFAGGNA